jgi:hypothetical protein
VKLAFGIVFLFVGAACLQLASHGLEATSPWQAYSTVLTRMREA